MGGEEEETKLELDFNPFLTQTPALAVLADQRGNNGEEDRHGRTGAKEKRKGMRMKLAVYRRTLTRIYFISLSALKSTHNHK